jgi:hypothetical protein
MQGVTTALVAFIFFCVIFPERVKNRPQFYAGLGLICLIILLDALSNALAGSAFRVFSYFATAFLQVVAILVMFMAAGGLSWHELKDEMARSYEVIRRGGEEKEIIIPLSGQKPKPRRSPGETSDSDTVDEDAPRQRIDIDEPLPPSAVPPPSAGTIEQTPRPGAPDSSIPLE